ncbi:Phage membrane protein, partial [Candidatus Arthromitus sp. SFB-3]
LTQAMGSGVLRGEEFNSILEQAPNIIESIAEYMDVPKGALKDLAGEGKITANIVKNAMFETAEKTNAKFNSMPKTFSQIATSVQNTALMAFQPVLEKLNDVMNSDAFNTVIQNIINGLSTLANIATNAFNVLIAIG